MPLRLDPWGSWGGQTVMGLWGKDSLHCCGWKAHWFSAGSSILQLYYLPGLIYEGCLPLSAVHSYWKA